MCLDENTCLFNLPRLLASHSKDWCLSWMLGDSRLLRFESRLHPPTPAALVFSPGTPIKCMSDPSFHFPRVLGSLLFAMSLPLWVAF